MQAGTCLLPHVNYDVAVMWLSVMVYHCMHGTAQSISVIYVH